METRLLRVVFTFLVAASASLAGPHDAQWKSVDDATNQGLPQTAIERLEPIIAQAMTEKSYAEAIKAIGRKIALEGTIEGIKPEEKIVRMQAEIEKAPAAMKPVMEAILAHWYWQYFQHNRWRFLERTQTAESPGPDMQTWDLARILAEIDRHFTAALADESALKATPIDDFDDLLDKGHAPDSYRPTLFDFLAHEALRFYQAGEHAAVAAEEEFEIEATSPIFGDSGEFMAWRPKTTDTASPQFKSIGLYQAVVQFHESKSNRSALYDVDLARLIYGGNVAIGEDKDTRYQAALERFIKSTARHEISARALAALAERLNSLGEPVRAHALATRGLAAFPQSAGATMCFNLIQQIEAKSARLETEFVWNAPWPTLDVTYRNVTRVYFRALAVDFDDYVAQVRWNYGGLERNRLKELLAATPAFAWDADLPPTTDFKERTERLAAPTTLKPGFYLIVASHDRSFSEGNNQVCLATVWVSDLALISRTDSGGTEPGGFVLNAITGEPVAGATVRRWRRNNDGWFKPIAPVATDASGRFTSSTQNESVILLAEHDGHAVSSAREMYFSDHIRNTHSRSRTVFFTDRAIYRPGQTINYKGICIRSDETDARYETVSREMVIVRFYDPNGKQIAHAIHRTNDYGSFSGVFTAPRDRAMGRMSLVVEDGSRGATSFNVEDYKRPKFQVAIEAPAESAKLDASVTMVGRATAYTGAAIGGAKVKWRVERSVQLPAWCWWWQPPEMKAIAHGSAVTEPDGTFKVEFVATPDRAVPEKNEPVFVFSVHADVTDTNGETRSDDRSVKAGYTALQASLRADEWQTPEQPVEFSLTTSSLDRDPQPASGAVTIHALKQPSAVERAPLTREAYWWSRGAEEPKADPSNPDSWEPGDVVYERAFAIDASGAAKVSAPLSAGFYRASLETKDRFGRRVTARQTVQVVDPRAGRYEVKLPNVFLSSKWSVEPGETFGVLWGTGYESGRALVELECNGKRLKSYWTAGNRTQEFVEQPVTEEMRGGFTVRITYVRENRAYFNERIVTVPWSNKELAVKWESFRSKLLPGQKETWTAVVTGPDAKRSVAEMVAAMYDASLDQFLPHQWPEAFRVFRSEFSQSHAEFQNSRRDFQLISVWRNAPARPVEWSYRAFPQEIIGSLWGWGFPRARGGVPTAAVSGGDELIVLSPFSVAADASGSYRAASSLAGSRKEMLMDANTAPAQSEGADDADEGALPPSKPDLSKISARTNLNETAFFFPHLTADDNGEVRTTFTMPEALTEWKFLGFAHDQKLRAGFLTDKVVTAKDLMVEPNPPRFVREGDAIEFTVKVSNQSEQPQTGVVRLTFADAASQESVDDALANRTTEQPFELPAKQSRSYSWRIAVPDGIGFLTYKAVGATATLSDGEEGFLPVLSRRILVTESLPLPIRGRTTKQFAFKKLLASGASDTLRHQSLTVQMTSQPAWYAVMALPYLMEFPYECSEQVFNRFYANTLARHIANSDPKIRRTFDLWKNTPALDSPLEKNQDLKAVMLEETPWLRQAKSESQSRRNAGLLFDGNRLDEGTARGIRKLTEQQLGDGLWPWFPGGRPSEYISLYIMTGFGRLRNLGVDIDVSAAIKALGGLDVWMSARYREIARHEKPEEYVPGYTEALYLYGRSFFLKDQPIAQEHRSAVNFFLRQSRRFWLEVNSRQSEAHLALALQRFGDVETPQAIMRSIKERSVSDEELGMFWRERELSWWWYRAPIETQALMIEAFAEITGDLQAVEDCKVWLLKQKQTQDWKTTKATADAVYGLLLRGGDMLASDELVEVSLGGEWVRPGKLEAGTGFYEQTFGRAEIKPAMGEVMVKKVDDGVSWGSVHWQYLEDVAKVTPHEGTPLKLKKTLWLKETTGKGQELKPVTGPLSVGDELVVRIELRTDRDMEFVHLKDQRGSGTEPVSVLSRYQYQDGLAYYESTRDTASHFFIDYLPKGVYVFEYSTRIQLRGRYQTGIAEIQCMYAPEFNSHSESILLEIK